MGENHTHPSDQGSGRNFSQVQVINRAAKILRTVRDNPNLNLSQLAREVGLARTTVYRIVATLEMEGLIKTDTPDGQIELGLELISLARAVKSSMRREIRPFLEGLSVAVDETVDHSIYENGRLTFIDQVSRPRRLTAVSGVGTEFPLHCTANGKAVLATLPEEELEEILARGLKVYTPKTITDPEKLIEELEQVKAEGIAYDFEEHTLGICAVGAAIPGLMNSTILISVPVPSIRFYGNEEKFSSALLRTVEAIRMRFGLPWEINDNNLLPDY